MDVWKELLKKAIAVLDAAKVPYDEWTLGGGTALMIYFDHRESKDIDVFLSDAQYLTMLTPRLLSVGIEINDYVEASNFLKLKLSKGEIDFIIAPHLTEKYYMPRQIMEREMRLETPEEIIVKKFFYRAEVLKTRDIIDIAVVLENRKDKLMKHSDMFECKLEVLKRRWSKLKGIYSVEVSNLKILKEHLIEDAPLLFENFLQELTMHSKKRIRG